MSASVQTIPLTQLALAFIPVAVVLGILFKWSLNAVNALYAVSRMLGQLLLIGYLLVYIFQAEEAWVVLLVLAVMLFSSSWIALRSVPQRRRPLFFKALGAIALGGGTTLLLITQGVLALEPWFGPRYMIPLAGMIFANAMNCVSLSAERMHSETERRAPYVQARKTAFGASLIPTINSLFAVGLVSLPGMMTGQILSGVSALIAARYQIMVMCMLFGAAGISSAVFLLLTRREFEPAPPTDAGPAPEAATHNP